MKTFQRKLFFKLYLKCQTIIMNLLLRENKKKFLTKMIDFSIRKSIIEKKDTNSKRKIC